LDCDGDPVINGGHRINNGAEDLFVYSDANGNINTLINNCGQTSLAIQAFEHGSSFMGSVQNVAVGPSIVLGDVSACDEETYYLDVSFDGGPTHTFYDGFDGQSVSISYELPLSFIKAKDGAESMNIFVNGGDVGTHDTRSVFLSLGASESGSSSVNPTGVNVTYTRVDTNSGGTVEGTFTGGFIRSSDNEFITLTGSFKIRIP
jgi:hypothetical protein